MAHEIERKFLVASMPTGFTTTERTRLRQAYLAVDGPVEVRLRESNGATTLTVKAGSGLIRAEVEVPLDDGDATELWPHAAGRSIEKVRHLVPLPEGLIAELDEYDGALLGLKTVEVEFSDRRSAEAFAPPPWFGREITSEPGWSNAELASRGLPHDR